MSGDGDGDGDGDGAKATVRSLLAGFGWPDEQSLRTPDFNIRLVT